MPYSRTLWKDKVVEFPRRFAKSNETSQIVELNASPGLVTEAGTPVNAVSMNKIEAGIGQAHWFAVTTNVGNAYSATLDPAPAAYVQGMTVRLMINVASTGAVTINLNGFGAKAVKSSQGVAVANWKLNAVVTLVYNGTDFILQGEGSGGNAVAADVLIAKTFDNINGPQVGTMPRQTGAEFAGWQRAQVAPNGAAAGRIHLKIPQGAYLDTPFVAPDNGQSGVLCDDADFQAANIKSGIDIFGLVGNLIPKFLASGQVGSSAGTTTFLAPNGTTPAAAYWVTVGGLNFTPYMIVVSWRPNGSNASEFSMYKSQFHFFDSGWWSDIFCSGGSGIGGVRASGNAYVNGGGFQMPVAKPSVTYDWWAIG